MSKAKVSPEIEDLRTVMSIAAGRRWMWSHIGSTGALSDVYASHPSDLAYNTGRKAIGLMLLGTISGKLPELFLLMQQEAIADQQRRRTEDERKNKKRRERAGVDSRLHDAEAADADGNGDKDDR